MKSRKRLAFFAALGLWLSSYAVACESDDDGDDDAVAGDADTDTDTDTDTDADSDSGDGFGGILQGETKGARVQVRTLMKKDMELSATIFWSAFNGDVNAVEVQEIRVFLEGATTAFFTTPGKDDIKTGIEFDGVVLQDYPQEIGYSYVSESMNGFEQHCKTSFQVEVDATYGNGQALTLGPWGGSSEIVDCLEE